MNIEGNCHYIVALHLIGTKQGAGAQVAAPIRRSASAGRSHSCKIAKRTYGPGEGRKGEASKHQENFKRLSIMQCRSESRMKNKDPKTGVKRDL